VKVGIEKCTLEAWENGMYDFEESGVIEKLKRLIG